MKEETKIIGVAGAMTGIGVTHFAITLANYSAAQKRRKTALIELSGNHAIEEIAGSQTPFEKNGVSYYPNLSMKEIPLVLNKGYEVVIFDMGSTFYRIRMEFLRCREKIIIGSLSPWRKQEYYRFILDEMGGDMQDSAVVFLANNGMKKDKKDKKEFYKMIGEPVYLIPYLPDAFHPEKNEFLDRFL